MRRRNLLSGTATFLTARNLSIFTATAASSLVVAKPSSAKKLPPLDAQLLKAYQKLKQLYEWIDWAEEGVPKMIDGKIPPTPPGPCADDLSIPLQNFTEEINNIEVVIALPEISYNELPGENMRETRALLAQKFILIYEATDLFRIFEVFEVQVSQKKLDLHSRLSILQILSDSLLKLASVPLPATYASAVGCWSTLEFVYKERFLQAIEALEALERRSKTAKTSNQTKLSALINEHKNFLALEIAQLDAEQQVQDDLEQAYQNALNKLKEAQDEEAILSNTLKKIGVRIEAYALDIEKLTLANVDARNRISTLRNRISSWQNKLKQSYSYCPNGYSYSKCNHGEEKKRWNKRQNNIRNSINSARKSISQLNSVVKQNAELIDRYAIEKSQLETQYIDLKNDLSELKKLVSDYQSDGDEKLKQFNERKFTTPVAILKNSSEQEEYNLNQIAI